MHITRVFIKGYRSVRECVIEFKPGKNILIGKNSSGKSNIISAIDILFGEKHPTKRDINESDFYYSNEVRSETIDIAARLEGDDINEAVIADQRGYWVYPIADPIISRDGAIIVNSDVFRDIDTLSYGQIIWQDLQKKYFKGGTSEFNQLVSDIKSSPFYYMLYRAIQLDDYRDFRAEFRFVFRDIVTDKYYVIANMPYNFRDGFSNSAVMPAFREPHTQMRISGYNWYSKLIRRAWETASKEDDIAKGLEAAKLSLASLANPVFDALAQDINSKIKVGFKGASVSFQFLDSGKHDLHKGVKVYLDDGMDDLLTRKGSGVQSAFIISMFTYYCMQNHNTSILIIEEPEVFLHPHARRAISRRLDDFIKAKSSIGKTNQVIVTTHSEDIIQTSGAETISIVRSTPSGTRCHTLNFSTDLDDKEAKRLLKTRVSETLFSDKVILCEGEEEHFLPKAYEAFKGDKGHFDDYNISVINVGGKGSLITVAKMLNKLGIEWYALADFDFLDDTCEKFANDCGIDNNILPSIRDLHSYVSHSSNYDLQQSFKSLCLDNFPEDGREKLIEVIEKFKEQLGVWILSKGCFEDYLTQEGQFLKKGNGKIDNYKLLSICLDDENSVSNYFETDEYNDMFERFSI